MLSKRILILAFIWLNAFGLIGQDIHWESYSKDTTALSFKRHGLKEISEEICAFTKLKHLDLSKNKLHTLPDCLRSLPLVDLDLERNKFKTFPEVLQHIPTLASLNLGRNYLDSLPNWLIDIPKLKALFVFDNNLSVFPKNLSTHPHLRYMDLDQTMYNREEISRIKNTFPNLRIDFGAPCNCPSASVRFY